MKTKIIKLTQTKENSKSFPPGLYNLQNWQENIPCSYAIFPHLEHIQRPPDDTEKLYSSASQLKLLGEKKPFLISCHLGFPPLPVFCQTSKSILQVMANRLANLSKPELFDSFDTDLCVYVCMCVCILRVLPVSHYRKDTVMGPQQFKQGPHYNARSVSFALWHVMTDSFSAPSQSKQRAHTEKLKGFTPSRAIHRLPATLHSEQRPDTTAALWFLI